MKNLFSWSVLVSALSIYFYWYGYWYTEGYIGFFGQDIKAYDIPLQHIVIEGVLQTLIPVIKIIIALIVISFLSQFSKKQYQRFFKKVEINLIYIWLITKQLVPIFMNEKRQLAKEKTNSVVETEKKSSDKNEVRRINKIAKFREEIQSERIIRNRSEYIKTLEHEIGKEDSTTFDAQYLIHVAIFIVVLPFILNSLDYTNKVNKQGVDNAIHVFNCSIKAKVKDCEDDSYSQIILSDVQKQNNNLNNNSNQSWYLTDICLNRRCLVFNENKRAKFIDITDKEIVMGRN